MPASQQPAVYASELKEAFRRLEAHLEQRCPSAFEDLLPPARRAEIRLVESSLGWVFPTELWEYFEVHDGQGGDGPGALPPFELLDLESGLREWYRLTRRRGASLGAFPLASDGVDELICVQVSEGQALPVGSVFRFRGATGAETWVAPSIARWLESGLEGGLLAGEPGERASEDRPGEEASLSARSPSWRTCSSSVPPG